MAGYRRDDKLGELDGVDVIASGRGARRVSHEELVEFVSGFSSTSFLLALGAVLNVFPLIGDGPVVRRIGRVQFYLPQLSYLALLAATEAVGDKRAAAGDLLRAADMYAHLINPGIDAAMESGESAKEHIQTLSAFQQLVFQVSIRHEIARTFIIYERVWPGSSSPAIKSIQPSLDCETRHGFGVGLAIVLGFIYAALAAKSSGRVSRSLSIDGLQPPDTKLLDPDVHKSFIRMVSSTPEKLRNAGSSAQVPGPNFEPYRFNPLRATPVVVGFEPNAPELAIMPVPQLLLHRVTAGFYWEFRRLYGANEFSAAFGKVFDEYLYWLANECVPKRRASVVMERTFALPDGDEVPTPDLTVIEGNNAVFFEAKHLAVRHAVRQWADLRAMEQDAASFVGDAIGRQLLRFYDIIAAGHAPPEFSKIRHAEYVVVTYEPLTSATGPIREAAIRQSEAEMDKPLPFHPHVICVEEFERLMGIWGRQNLSGLLRLKREEDPDHRLTLQNWLARRGGWQRDARCGPIDSAFNEVMGMTGLHPDQVAGSNRLGRKGKVRRRRTRKSAQQSSPAIFPPSSPTRPPPAEPGPRSKPRIKSTVLEAHRLFRGHSEGGRPAAIVGEAVMRLNRGACVGATGTEEEMGSVGQDLIQAMKDAIARARGEDVGVRESERSRGLADADDVHAARAAILDATSDVGEWRGETFDGTPGPEERSGRRRG